jgi:hypothetical protein
VENEENPCEPDSVLIVEGLKFPIEIAKWILVESSEVLESSPFLSHISWLSCGHYELMEITICFLGKSSIIK